MRARIGLWSSLTVATVLALGVVAPAHAVMLASPELSVLGDDEAVCRIVNVGTTLITVKIQLLAQTTVVSEENEKVPPGSSAIVTGSGFTSGGMYCRFTGTFNKALVRASIDLVNADTFRTIVIAPAN